MGISLWQILLIAAAIAVIFGVPVFAIATEKSETHAGRKDFAIASFLFFIIYPIFNRIFSYFAENMGEAGFVILIIVLLVYCFVCYKYTRLIVKRARDAGIKKGYCYLFLVPLVNLLLVILLMIKKSAPADLPAASPDHA